MTCLLGGRFDRLVTAAASFSALPTHPSSTAGGSRHIAACDFRSCRPRWRPGRSATAPTTRSTPGTPTTPMCRWPTNCLARRSTRGSGCEHFTPAVSHSPPAVSQFLHTLRVEYAERRIQCGILFIVSLFYEYIPLEYVRVRVIYRVYQAGYGIRILVAVSQEHVNAYSTPRLHRVNPRRRGSGQPTA